MTFGELISTIARVVVMNENVEGNRRRGGILANATGEKSRSASSSCRFFSPFPPSPIPPSFRLLV